MAKSTRKPELPVFLLIAILSVTLLACAGMSSVSAETTAEASNGENDFSIVWITDTQYLSAYHPTYFTSLCNWISKHAAEYNIKMVVHTGDLVNSESNQTQWINANTSMSVLLNAGIPYCWDAGNHDYNATCWIGNQFAAFNPAEMAQRPYWVGDAEGGQSTAVHLSVNDWDFLILNLANEANDATLSWANNLLDANPESHAIVATHFYLNRTGGYEEWASKLRNSVLATHSSVFLTLSAHVYPLASSGFRSQVGDRHELVFNRQEKDNTMGAASLRILTFKLAQGTIDVKTFYLYSNTFLTDAENQFTLNTNFWNDSASSEIPELSVFAVLILSVAFSVCVLILKLNGRKTQVRQK
jgi:hypothetical protein